MAEDKGKKGNGDPAVEKRAFKISEFCSAYGIGRTTFYQELKSNRLKAFKVGRMTLISEEAATEWVNICQKLFPANPRNKAKVS